MCYSKYAKNARRNHQYDIESGYDIVSSHSSPASSTAQMAWVAGLGHAGGALGLELLHAPAVLVPARTQLLDLAVRERYCSKQRRGHVPRQEPPRSIDSSVN